MYLIRISTQMFKLFKIKFLVFLLYIAFVSFAYAKPIDFLGLNWSMSFQEMQFSLEKRGYACGENICKAKTGGGIVSFQGYPASTQNVKFNCESYNGCKKSFQSLTEYFINKYAFDFIQEQAIENNEITVRFCGLGSEEDGLCVEGLFENSKERNVVRLLKYRFKQSGLTSNNKNTNQILEVERDDEIASGMLQSKITSSPEQNASKLSKCDGMFHLKNICWGMTTLEMEQGLKSLGYAAIDSVCDANSCTFVNKDNGATVFIFHNGDSDKYYISFSCGSFGICGHHMNRIASDLVKMGVIKPVSDVQKFKFEEFGNGTNNFLSEQVCGNDNVGQSLCFKSTSSGVVLELNKGTCGS